MNRKLMFVFLALNFGVAYLVDCNAARRPHSWGMAPDETRLEHFLQLTVYRGFPSDAVIAARMYVSTSGEKGVWVGRVRPGVVKVAVGISEINLTDAFYGIDASRKSTEELFSFSEKFDQYIHRYNRSISEKLAERMLERWVIEVEKLKYKPIPLLPAGNIWSFSAMSKSGDYREAERHDPYTDPESAEVVNMANVLIQYAQGALSEDQVAAMIDDYERRSKRQD